MKHVRWLKFKDIMLNEKIYLKKTYTVCFCLCKILRVVAFKHTGWLLRDMAKKEWGIIFYRVHNF
jgi:hypothetical protein